MRIDTHMSIIVKEKPNDIMFSIRCNKDTIQFLRDNNVSITKSIRAWLEDKANEIRTQNERAGREGNIKFKGRGNRQNVL